MFLFDRKNIEFFWNIYFNDFNIDMLILKIKKK
jgi:hypothetical protein